MKKLALVFLIACEQPAPPPPPAPVKAAPASMPAQAASLPASLPVKADLKTVDSGPRVLAVTGKVFVDGKEAVVGTPVTPTSIVETKDDSSARITIMPHSVIAVRPNTKFSLGTSTRKKWSLKLALGAVWSFLPHGASYEVTTGNAVAGVRGTILYVSENDAAKSAVCACDGEVELTTGKKHEFVKSKMQHIGSVIAGEGKQSKVVVRKQSPKNPPGHDNEAETKELLKLRDSVDR